jgi:membrane protein DedA with SNARE-associated domain
MEQQLLDWLARYGAPVIFAAQVLGIFGLPIPDEFLLTVAGALVRKGDLALIPAVLAAIGGSGSGITLSFVLGRTVGVIGLRRVGHVPDQSLRRAERLFERFGGWLLTFGYFVPGVRHVTAITAGSMRVTFRFFAACAYPGAVLWSLTFLAVGYYAGNRWRPMLTALRPWTWLFGSLLIVVALMIIVTKHRSSHAKRPLKSLR